MIPVHELLESARKNGDRTALVFGERHVSYAELLDRVTGAAAAFDRMVRPGERIALLCTNSYEYVSTSLAIELTGAIRVPINIKASRAEIGKIVADCAPALVLHEDSTRHLVPDACPARLMHVDAIVPEDDDGMRFLDRVGPEDTCSINYTSGSTGNPRGKRFC